MLLNAILRIVGETQLPPTATIALVREQSRTLDVRIAGLPVGETLEQLVLTAKVDDADPDAELALQKNLTATTDVATVGQITDPGTAGVARATITLLPADSAELPDTLEYQLWGVCSDGRQGPALMGPLTSIAPIPFNLPASPSEAVVDTVVVT